MANSESSKPYDDAYLKAAREAHPLPESVNYLSDQHYPDHTATCKVCGAIAKPGGKCESCGSTDLKESVEASDINQIENKFVACQLCDCRTYFGAAELCMRCHKPPRPDQIDEPADNWQLLRADEIIADRERQLRAAIAELRKLQDSAYVHVKILRGEIALTKAQAIHIAGLPADVVERVKALENECAAGKVLYSQYRNEARAQFEEDAATIERLLERLQNLEHIATEKSAEVERLSPKASEWVAVEDGLPELDKKWEEGRYAEVLVMCENGICAASYDKFMCESMGTWAAEPSGSTLRCVTHWRPLPSPPSELLKRDKGESE